jgi:hypothetical protein
MAPSHGFCQNYTQVKSTLDWRLKVASPVNLLKFEGKLLVIKVPESEIKYKKGIRRFCVFISRYAKVICIGIFFWGLIRLEVNSETSKD